MSDYTKVGTQALRSPPSDGSVRLGPGTIGYEAGTSAKIDLVEGMRVRRRSEKWPTYRIGANEVRCEWPRGEATIVVGGLLAELRLLAADGKLLVVGDEDGVDRLPHILWRTAKQLVSLLEKEYGFGQKEIRDRSPIGHNLDPEVVASMAIGAQAAEPNLTRTVTCGGCGGTFKIKDGRTGSLNEVVYCADCAEPYLIGAHPTVNIK